MGASAGVATALACAPLAALAQTPVPSRIEIFTSAEHPITTVHDAQGGSTHAPIDIQTVALDAIATIEARLSAGLPADPERARREATRRIHALAQTEMADIERAAMGLAKMLQYGLDRFPAIVLDGEVALLGVTDTGEALRRYRHWRAGRAP